MRRRRSRAPKVVNPPAGSDVPPIVTPEDVEKEMSIDASVKRLRYIEGQCFADLERARKLQPGMVGILTEQYVKTVEQRRRVEKDLAKILSSQGDVVPRAEIEAKDRADNEVIRSDLGFGLPSSLATALAGKAWTAAEVKRIATDHIREMVKRWNSGGITSKEAVP